MANRSASAQGKLFESLYERDFLLRTLGDTVRNPDVALGELVANAWDAGASKVDITIPKEDARARRLIVQDDGTGLTRDQFHERWMTLGYDRAAHQGNAVEFPSDRTGRRRAYGRNGQGRHGLLCFGDAYRVETWRDKVLTVFDVRVDLGKAPFVAKTVEVGTRRGHGTRLSVDVIRNCPNADRVRQMLSSKFLHDPGFTIFVNNVSLSLTELAGLAEHRTLTLEDPDTQRSIALDVYLVEAEAGRAKHQSGVAFWVGGRLVGTPGWVVMGTPFLDGRTRAGRRITVIVKSDDLHDEVNESWTGFRQSALTTLVAQEVLEVITDMLRTLSAGRVRETTSEVLADHAEQLRTMSRNERAEVVEVAAAIAHRDPLVSSAVLDAAVSGIIDVKKKTTPISLIQRIMALPIEDQEGIHRLLDEWTVRDALTVLDEIGRRIKIVEVLEKLMGQKDVDEVHVLHPLVTQARWLFGPEYDSPHYASNVGLRTAVEKVFGERLRAEAFVNSRKRPDLLALNDATLSAVATEDSDPDTGIAKFRRILLVELKRGGFKITRKEMDQASGYAEDLINCGVIDGAPFINVYVVGHELDSKTTTVRKIGDRDAVRIEAMTFSQLVRTANTRLFKIRENVEERYPESGSELLDALLRDPQKAIQLGLEYNER